MIKYDRLWSYMEEHNISTYRLREQCGLDNKTIKRLKINDNIETKTLNRICEGLGCTLADIAEYVKD